jgi:biopolymer transport protein ExbD
MSAGPAIGGGGGKKVTAGQTVGVLNLLTDLAFNLLIFFVVLASTDPEVRGRPQQTPSSTQDSSTDQKPTNVEVTISRNSVKVNEAEVPIDNLLAKMTELLAGKTKPEDRIVIVKSDGDTPYRQWIKVTGLIEKAGGMITLQIEEEKEVQVR